MDTSPFLEHPAVKGALTGLMTAMLVDYAAFRGWKSYDDAFTYEWRVALWRWLQGFVSGAVAGLGLEVVL